MAVGVRLDGGEPLEQQGLQTLLDAEAIVAYRDHEGIRQLHQRHVNPAGRPPEAGGIVQHFVERGAKPERVAPGGCLRDVELDLDRQIRVVSLGFGHQLHQERGQVHRLIPRGCADLIQACHLAEAGEQASELPALFVDAQAGQPLVLFGEATLGEQGRVAVDDPQRRAQLVGSQVEEVCLHLVDLAELVHLDVVAHLHQAGQHVDQPAAAERTQEPAPRPVPML